MDYEEYTHANGSINGCMQCLAPEVANTARVRQLFNWRALSQVKESKAQCTVGSIECAAKPIGRK
jgi:hypothetical protein